MNHKEKLKNIYSLSLLIDDIQNIPEQQIEYIQAISDNSYNQKGVYTVIITLLTHKTLYPEQDISNHQSHMSQGFSGRGIDTDFITPTLRELELPSMAESGWLTRSLEQPHPYNLTYPGKIDNKVVKKAFLGLIDYVQKNPHLAENVLRVMLNKVITLAKSSQVALIPLISPESLNIFSIVSSLEEHFSTKYRVRGGSKLSVLAIYAVYQSLIREIKRYESFQLANLGSHTSSDLTSKTAGDIQIFDSNHKLLEVVEVKHDKEIDLAMISVVYEKIRKFNPLRYYIFSRKDIKVAESAQIQEMVSQIRTEHGCQVIINGVLPTIKYYLRLLSLENYITNYSNLVIHDKELKAIHKQKWNELVEKLAQQ